jgi:type VI secretion system secreted protein VgrG
VRVTIDIPSYAGHGFSVRTVDVVEGLSMPFEVALGVRSPDPDLDFERLAGAPATFAIDHGPLGRRSFSGIVAHVELSVPEPTGLSTYTLRVVPRLWLLSQGRGHRIFQHKTALAIAKALLAEWKIEVTTLVQEDELATLEVRVQYGETDLEFLERMLEEAGISYFFDDQRGDGASHLVLASAPERGATRHAGIPHTTEPTPTWEKPFVADVRIAHETRTGKVTIADYDFRRPDAARMFHAELYGPGEAPLERYAYLPGAAIADLPAASVKSNDTPAADGQSFARTDEHAGYGLAERGLASLRQGRRRVELTTSLVDLSPGTLFSVEGSPRPELAKQQRMLVTETRIDGRVDQSWTVRIVASFADVRIRPAQRTAWPRIDGLQSATVMGPPGQGIHTDEFGRVRVRFHWDREGFGERSERGPEGLARSSVPIVEGIADDHRSAWVRVDDGWAGAGFGTIALPRVGQEVLVAFYEGNPDQPVIVGRVYDASNPWPRPLPGSATESVWRTASSPSGGYHELSFDDARGRERMLLQSERDLEKTVVREEVEVIHGDRATFVGHNMGTTITGTDGVTVGQMHAVGMAKVEDARAADGGAPNVTALGTKREIIARRITLTTGGATIVLDGPDITVTAQHEVSIVAGGTVVIQGEPYVQINPPLVAKKADATKPTAPPDHVAWFQLTSEGHPIADARVHLEHASGTVSAPLVTDGAGRVRVPVDQPGAYKIKVGDPKPAPAPVATKPAVTVGTTPAQATPKALPTGHEVPVVVEIVSPAAGASFDVDPGSYPGAAPSMPRVKLKAKVLVEGQETSAGSVRWEMSLAGKYRVRDGNQADGYRWQSFKFPAGTTRTKPNEELDFQLLPAEIVGGDLSVKAVYEAGADLGNLKAVKELTGLKVVGKNPARADVEKYIVDNAGDLAWLFLRMFCHESEHTLLQFRKTEPRYGPPSGVGAAQQDPEAPEWVWPKDKLTTPSNFFPRIFWDWRKNIVSGIEHFRSAKVPIAKHLLGVLQKAHPSLPAPAEGVVLRAAIRAYNGGREYDASPDGKHYVVSPHTIPANTGYVEWVLGDPHGSEAPKHPVPDDVKALLWPAK